jgi:hypothetical protein
MTKWKDTTASGHKILWREEIKEGERKGWSCGAIVQYSPYGSRSYLESTVYAIWDKTGRNVNDEKLNLVPAEPEIVCSGWVNVYSASCSESHPTQKEATTRKSVMTPRLGLIRIDWLSDNTFTVNKEEI